MLNARHLPDALTPSSTVRFHSARDQHVRRLRQTEWFEDVHNRLALAYWMLDEGVILGAHEALDVVESAHKYQHMWERYEASESAVAA